MTISMIKFWEQLCLNVGKSTPDRKEKKQII